MNINKRTSDGTITITHKYELTGALFILLLILKLSGVIDIGWIWVFAPLWISLGLTLAIILISFTVIGIMTWCEGASSASIWNRRVSMNTEPLIWDAKTQTMYGPCVPTDGTYETQD